MFFKKKKEKTPYSSPLQMRVKTTRTSSPPSTLYSYK